MAEEALPARKAEAAEGPSRAKVLKLFCRCGQKVSVTFPTPGPVGKCPRCGHSFEIPPMPEDR